MVGGQREAFERAQPVLEVLRRLVFHAGGAGAGQHAKMVNQIAIASGLVGDCEALVPDELRLSSVEWPDEEVRS